MDENENLADTAWWWEQNPTLTPEQFFTEVFLTEYEPETDAADPYEGWTDEV
jgi:hypothetical protein